MSAVSTRPRTTCRSSWRLSRFAFTELESPPLSDRPEGGRASAACASDPDETKPPAPAVARTHISKLTPEIFDSHFRSKGVPLVIEGALDPAIDWRLESFVGSFDAGVSYQCRVHGGDSFGWSRNPCSGRALNMSACAGSRAGDLEEASLASCSERKSTIRSSR